MATGIDYNHPDFQEGYELFETLFRDRPEATREPSPQREMTSPGEERRRGMDLFEQLFYDRLHPPEVPEEPPESLKPESPEEVPEPSPVEMATPPGRRMPPGMTPPDWLLRSAESEAPQLDLWINQPNWFRRRFVPKMATPDTPVPYWNMIDVDPRERFQDDVFEEEKPASPPKPDQEPVPEPELEPPIPAGNFENFFDWGMNQMHHELQKYAQDSEFIEKFVKMHPDVRDYNILEKELQILVKLYLPELDAEGLEPEHAIRELENYMKETEKKLGERYGGEFISYHYQFKFGGISEEVSIAMLRIHRTKVFEAIDSYKRNYFFLKKEIEKETAELMKVKEEYRLETEEYDEIYSEIDRLKEQERIAREKYKEGLIKRHKKNCFYLPEKMVALRRFLWIQNEEIPKYKREMESDRDDYHRQVVEMENWVNMFPPNMKAAIWRLLVKNLSKDGYEPVPVDGYMRLVKELSRTLQMKKKSREEQLAKCQSMCKSLSKKRDKEVALNERNWKTFYELLDVENKLIAELKSLKLKEKQQEALWAQMREEKYYYWKYNETLWGRQIMQDEEPQEEEDLPAGYEPEPEGSGMFDITQIESTTGFGESPDFIDKESSPFDMPQSGDEELSFSEMFNLPDLQGSGFSPSPESETGEVESVRPPSGISNISGSQGSGFSISPEQEPDVVDTERPPSGMFNISGLQGSGFSSSPGADEVDTERPPSGMFNISGLQGSGFSISPESDDLDAGRPPSGMFNISGLQGSGFSISPQPDDLDAGRPPSDMFNISGLQGSGFSISPEADDLGAGRPPSDMFNISGLQGSGFSSSPFDSLERSKSPFDSLERSATSLKRSFVIPSPGRREQLQMDVEIIPQDIRRSPSGQRVVCDLAVLMQEARRAPRGIEIRKFVNKMTPPYSKTVGRTFDRKHGIFTPKSAFMRDHIAARGALFKGDFQSPESPWGTGRKTHPELMNLPPLDPSPRPPKLDNTIEWETNPQQE